MKSKVLKELEYSHLCLINYESVQVMHLSIQACAIAFSSINGSICNFIYVTLWGLASDTNTIALESLILIIWV
jgi:hypothetical protein